MTNELSYLSAIVARAAQEGGRSVVVDVKEIQEVLRLAESNFARHEVEMVGKHAGWINVDKLCELKSGNLRHVHVARKKGDGYDVELFYKADTFKVRAQRKRDLEQGILRDLDGIQMDRALHMEEA